MEVSLKEGQKKALDILTKWYLDKSEGKEIATLEGFAGTGKTFLTKYLIETLGIRNVLVSAPTNRAKTVISEQSGFPGKTVHSILGLQLNLDLSDFNPMNPMFAPKGRPDIHYNLIVIDEGSMVNTYLYNEIKKLAKRHNVKILFMGDRYQLPPVKEKVSKVFTKASYKAVLTEVVRQGDNNPNSELIMIAINDVINNTDYLDEFIFRNSQTIRPADINNSKGFIYVPATGYNNKDYILSDKDNLYNGSSKYLAWTNDNITNTIKNLRTKVYNLENLIHETESLIGYRTVTLGSKDNTDVALVNSEEYIVKFVNPMVLNEGMQGYQIMIENIYTGHSRYINLVNTEDSKTAQIYKSIVTNLYDKGKALGKRHWIEFYNFINNNLSLSDVYKGSYKIKSKDLYYSYGITIHKSQGGTFKNCFVNITNINKNFNEEDRRRLKYVALSRVQNTNIIF